MSAAMKPFKTVLGEDVIPTLLLRQRYCSSAAIRAELTRRRVTFAPLTLNRYLVDLRKAGVIHDAGKGWYSSIAQEFVLDTKPLQELIGLLTGKFPLLEFACWSTQQVNPYMHHLLGKFVTFVHAPRDTMQSVYEHLRSLGYTAYLNPTKAEVAKTFTVEDRTVVVRPLLSKTPADAHAVRIEGLLVDLCVELRTLPLMDADEFRGMVTRLLTSQRVAFAEFASYASWRGVSLDQLLDAANQPSPVWAQTGVN